jgi:hypothetical protein
VRPVTYEAVLETVEPARRRGLRAGRFSHASDMPSTRVHALDPDRQGFTLCARPVATMTALGLPFEDYADQERCGQCRDRTVETGALV